MEIWKNVIWPWNKEGLFKHRKQKSPKQAIDVLLYQTFKNFFLKKKKCDRLEEDIYSVYNW